MTEQERAAALLDDVKARIDFYKAGDGSFDDGSAFSFTLMLSDVETMESALRAYARPAPADLREAIISLIVSEGWYAEDSREPERLADAILSLLPQTQAASECGNDDVSSFEARAKAAESILRAGEG